MRLPTILTTLTFLFTAATATAQPQEKVKVAVVLIPEQGAGLAEQTIVSMGIRRGLRGDRRLDDEHPADILIRDRPEELFEAEAAPDEIAEMLKNGQARGAEERARAVLQVFEDNLPYVKRSVLADAYTLLGAAQCMQRERGACEESFRRVVVFREHFFYDPERYPQQFADVFNNIQMDLTDRGVRGSIEIITYPEGAEVFVDGHSYGPSPTVAEGLLVGDHYVTVKAIGYEKRIVRATVEESFQGTVDLALDTSDESLLITQAMEVIPDELGEERAGDAISSIGTNLFVQQTVVGTIRPDGEGAVMAHLYLYDLRTKFLLAEQEARISLDEEEGSLQAQDLVRNLYDGVDLSGRIEAPDEGPDFGESTPIWKRWWFWTGAAAVVIAAVVIGVVIANSGGESLPAGFYQSNASIQAP